MVEGVRLAPEVGVEPGDVLSLDGIDLWIAEQVRALRQRDDERLVGEVDCHQGDAKHAFPRHRRVGPFRPRDGPVVGPRHRVLILYALRIERDGCLWLGRRRGGRERQQETGSED